jgi:hypothetical protein
MLRFLRQVHLYIGVFIAPSLLFFAFTGAIQTFSLHETTPGSSYKPPALLVSLAQIHKKQTYIIPVRRPRPAEQAAPPATAHSDAKGLATDHPSPAAPAPAPSPAPQTKSHMPMKIFFLLVAIGLFTSNLTGIYMSYKYNGNKLVITLLLVGGSILPPLLMSF